MAPQTDFATRVKHINKAAAKTGRKRQRKSRPSLGSLLVMPAMTSAFMAGGVVMYWEVLERPTDTPFEFASTLTNQLLSYLV